MHDAALHVYAALVTLRMSMACFCDIRLLQTLPTLPPHLVRLIIADTTPYARLIPSLDVRGDIKSLIQQELVNPEINPHLRSIFVIARRDDP